MFHIAMTRQEAEWITSDDQTIKHYGTQAVLVKVEQYTKDGVFIKTWDSIMDVQRELGISNTQISSCCIGRKDYKYAGGFAWKHPLPNSPEK